MRYTVYKFPSLHGTPHHFRTSLGALLYGFVCSFQGYVAELEDLKTETYKAYWL